ncbi:MAG: citrate lyase acyl carrier protein [Oscillospiraceae bacterium]
MVINRKAVSGTMESNDIFVEIEPAKSGVQIEVQSIVMNQFGKQIEDSVKDVLKSFDVKNATVRVNDRGAVDCTIRARVETALKRAANEVK